MKSKFHIDFNSDKKGNMQNGLLISNFQFANLVKLMKSKFHFNSDKKRQHAKWFTNLQNYKIKRSE